MTVYGRPREIHFYYYKVDLTIANCDYICIAIFYYIFMRVID